IARSADEKKTVYVKQWAGGCKGIAPSTVDAARFASNAVMFDLARCPKLVEKAGCDGKVFRSLVLGCW
ncbi:MAG: hypothetical protein L3J88_10550, partial [Gammaproteobacteria bacterium]|nr:hypothetical protein [Gammaproteobacteria bacterium]